MTTNTAPLTMSQFATRADYDAAVAAQPVAPFDGYEVAPVHVETDGETCEGCLTGAEARELVRTVGGSLIWSLYGHLPEGGAQCIADYATESDALTVYAQITGRTKPEPCDEMRTLPPAVGIPTTHYPADDQGRAV